MGRRKIEIEPLTDDRNRTVTFVKRKAGLFKKAHELAVLCQVDLAVVIIGNNNKVYEFSSVDMSEILGFYESHIVGAKPNGGGKARPQESKSPENYGNYRKKRRLSEQLSKRDGSVVKAASQPAGEHAAHDSDSESESETPPRKRVKTEDFPTFNQPYKNEGGPVHKREDSSSSHRPVLRVQIPGEGAAPSAAIAATTTIGGGVSNSRDSARTITAIDNSPRILGGGSSLGSDSQAGNQGGGVQGSVQVPQLQLHTVTPAPPGPAPMTNSIRVPSINKPTNFMSFRDGTGNGDRKPTLPLPIQSKSQTSSPASATGPQLPQQSNMFLMQSPPANAYQSGLLPTPVMNQVFNPYSQNGPNTGNNSAGDHPKRPALFTNIPYSGDTPISGLPSKFVNDMFPSPSTFYAPQDWSDQRGMQMQNPNHNPNLQGQQNQQVQQPGNTGMTPIHGIPSYFMGMMPSGITPTTGAQMGMPSGGGNKPGQNRELPSPIHFMSGGSFTGKK